MQAVEFRNAGRRGRVTKDRMDDPRRVSGEDGLRLRARLRYLYHGSQPPAVRFRLAVIGVDIVIIAVFLAAPILRNMGWAF